MGAISFLSILMRSDALQYMKLESVTAQGDSGQRITQRELAEKLGVNQATVSRALSKGGRLSGELRARILREAERSGYRPDPVLSSLNAYRRTRRPITRGQALAWFGAMAPGEIGYEPLLFRAARARAEEMGYGMEYFWENEPGFSAARYEQIFQTRGIAGVVFGPRSQPHVRIGLKIDEVAAVMLGRSVDWPPVDRVSVDHFQTMETCYDAVRERGFRRIGLVLSEGCSERVAGVWTSSFLGRQARGADAGLVRLPVLLIEEDQEKAAVRFDAWWRRWKPDAIMTMAWRLGCVPVMRRLGVRFPGEVGVALLMVPEHEPPYMHFSGIYEPVGELAGFAADVLVGRIRNGARGIPSDRRVHLLPGRWMEGDTLKSRDGN
jgi:DNA-binding LacI/PurR family transcriptional regulator